MKSLPPFVWFSARLFLGFVFAYSGFSKLMEPVENFRGVIAQYQVVPYSFVPFIAITFPWIEFIFGTFLILGFAPRISALVLALLSFTFLIVLGSSNILLGQAPMSCGCFGESGIHLTVRQVFFLDIFDLAIGFKLYSIKEHPWSLDNWLKKVTSA